MRIYSTIKYFFKEIMGSSYEYDSHMDNLFSLVSKHLHSFRPVNFLDIGCGDGSRTIRLAQYFGIDAVHTYGVDNQEGLITNECAKLLHAKQIDLEMETLPYGENEFDLVVCNQVLEHLKNYDKVIHDILRVTRTGGYIMIGIPNLAHLINRIYLLFGIQPMCIAIKSQHVCGFTHRAFKKMLKSLSGVKYIDCAGSTIIYPLPLLLAQHLSKFFVGLCGYVCYLIRKE
jgi:ubiquinone/menaquinone biosynthesis C-methylase UbiE